MKLIAAVLLPLALVGCASRPLPAVDNVRFDPIRFFHGPSEGRGTLRKIVGAPVPISVSSESEGDLNLLKVTQVIREGSKPSRQRVWTIKRVGDGFAATLTDAAGPVRIAVDGGRAFIHYRTKSGLAIDQQLALQDYSGVLCNRLTVRKFGVRVAILEETIRRMPLAGNARTCIF